MATWSGRIERRIHLEVAMQISRVEPGSIDLEEKAITQHVSAHGVRLLTRRALQPQERLLITSLVGSEEPKPARVVYCQPLSERVIRVGLPLEKGQAMQVVAKGFESTRLDTKQTSDVTSRQKPDVRGSM
jgi:hypothetical protein